MALSPDLLLLLLLLFLPPLSVPTPPPPPAAAAAAQSRGASAPPGIGVWSRPRCLCLPSSLANPALCVFSQIRQTRSSPSGSPLILRGSAHTSPPPPRSPVGLPQAVLSPISPHSLPRPCLVICKARAVCRSSGWAALGLPRWDTSPSLVIPGHRAVSGSWDGGAQPTVGA